MIIDGKALAQEILESLAEKVKLLEDTKGLIPHMAVIRVGDDDATTSYITQKEKMAKEIGAVVSVYKYPEAITTEKLEESIDFLQQDPHTHALILQLPMPKHINVEYLLQKVAPEKDVDGFTKNTKFIVPLAAAALKVLEEAYIRVEAEHLTNFYAWLAKQNIVVIGKGKTGGEPIIRLLIKLGITPTVIDTKTENPEEITKNADIIICAVGREGIINKAMLKKDVILLGIGMSKGEDGKFYGDYNPDEIKDIASVYTPIPGGVGPVNVAMLMTNLVKAAELASR